MALYAMANNGVVIPAERDGALYNFFTGNQDYVINGIGNNFAITPSASSFLLTLGEGEAIVGGRHVVEKTTDNANSMIQLASNSTGYVVIRINLDWAVGTEARLFATNALVSEDLNNGGAIRDLPLYQYVTDGNGVTSFTDIRNVSSGSNVICKLEGGSLYMDYYNNGVVTRKQIGSTTPAQEIDAVPSDVKSGKKFIGQGSEDVQTGTFTAQTKTVTPSSSVQTITPDSGKYLSSVKVNAISGRTNASKFKVVYGDEYTDTINTGHQNTKNVGAVVWNCRGYIQGSNDNSSWSNIGDQIVADGSNQAASVNSMPIGMRTTTYRYIRFHCTWRYNNGYAGNVELFAIY